MADFPEETLKRVARFLDIERYEEAERLLIGVLRDTQGHSGVHWDAVLTLAELYEKQERYREGLILSREVPEKLEAGTDLGQRGLRLRSRLHTAEGEHAEAEACRVLLEG